MTELLPCPFCGGEGEMRESSTHDFYVKCCGCGAATRRNHENRTGAVIDWNIRAERTCRIVKTSSDSDYVDDWRYRCSECGCNIPVNERDPKTGDVINAANYCPNCGARVVDGKEGS